MKIIHKIIRWIKGLFWKTNSYQYLGPMPKKGSLVVSEAGLLFKVTKVLNRQRFIITLCRPK